MTKLLQRISFALSMCCTATCALAQSLVGDQVIANRFVDAPSFQWQWGNVNVTVVEGPSDTFSLSASPNLIVDIDASSIYMDFGTGGGGGPWALTESYITFEGMDFQPAARISSLGIETNVPGLSVSNLEFTSNSVRFNYGGLSTPAGTYARIQLLTTPVPEPAAWMLATIGGALLFAARARRKTAA